MYFVQPDCFSKYCTTLEHQNIIKNNETSSGITEIGINQSKCTNGNAKIIVHVGSDAETKKVKSFSATISLDSIIKS